MDTGSAKRPLLGVFYFFLLVNMMLILLKSPLTKRGLHLDVLWQGNLILMLATLLSVIFLTRSLREKKGYALLKNVYAGIILKLGICAAAAFIYIITQRKNVDKAALAICGLLYILYTTLEVYVILKLNKQLHGQAGKAT